MSKKEKSFDRWLNKVVYGVEEPKEVEEQQKYEIVNVFADNNIEGKLFKNRAVKCYGYMKFSKRGNPYIRIRIKLHKDYYKGDKINLVINEI